MTHKKVYQVSDEEFIKAAQECDNIRQALLLLGLKAVGGNYDVFKRRCIKLGIKVPNTNVQKRDQQIIRQSIINNDIVTACQLLYSRAAVLKKLNLKHTINSNIKWIDKKIVELKINTTHWTGQAHLRGKTHNWSKKTPLKEIMIKNSQYTNTHNLKRRLIKKGLLKNICAECGINMWKNKPLSLHLDHMNGERTDNRLKNLRLLCPNCHSQTETYCGKNKGKQNISQEDG